MRMITLAAAGALFALGGAANAQAPSATPPASPPPATAPQAPAEAPQAPAGTPAITSINVVALDELPEATKVQVNEIVAKRSAGEAEQLQQAIEGVPAVKAAVEAKGFSTRDVVIAQVDEAGELTIVTRRAG